MRKTPFYLNDLFMPLYKAALILAFMLGFASIFTGIGYGIYTYMQSDLGFLASMFEGFVLFLKGAGVTAAISFIAFFALWKRYQIRHANAEETSNHPFEELGLFRFA
jgi:predicted membrane protein